MELADALRASTSPAFKAPARLPLVHSVAEFCNEIDPKRTLAA